MCFLTPIPHSFDRAYSPPSWGAQGFADKASEAKPLVAPANQDTDTDTPSPPPYPQAASPDGDLCGFHAPWLQGDACLDDGIGGRSPSPQLSFGLPSPRQTWHATSDVAEGVAADGELVPATVPAAVVVAAEPALAVAEVRGGNARAMEAASRLRDWQGEVSPSTKQECATASWPQQAMGSSVGAAAWTHSDLCRHKERLTLAEKLEIIFLYSMAPQSERKTQVSTVPVRDAESRRAKNRREIVQSWPCPRLTPCCAD